MGCVFLPAADASSFSWLRRGKDRTGSCGVWKAKEEEEEEAASESALGRGRFPGAKGVAGIFRLSNACEVRGRRIKVKSSEDFFSSSSSSSFCSLARPLRLLWWSPFSSLIPEEEEGRNASSQGMSK